VIEQAEGQVATLMPGYLNARPVQVVSCSHWLLSYFWMLARDQERLSSVIGRASSSPLGSGVLAGIAYRVDRHDLAHQLDFGSESENSIDAVSDLDFGAEFLFAASLVSAHLNRLADDLLLFSHPALGFVTLDPAHTGGSLISRRDVATETVEQINGRSGQLLGKMTGFLAAFRTLPSTFTAESPDSRAAIFEASDLLTVMIETLTGAVNTLTIHPDRMWDALNENVLASDLVEYLVTRGETYEKACSAVDKLLTKAESSGKPIAEVELATLQKESNFFDADVFGYLDHSRSAAQRATIGGTAPAAIRSQIRQAMNWLVEAGLE
jgi:argininosuccinate lyase